MSHLDRAYSLQNVQEAQSLYDEWSTTYDSDMTTHQYVAPAIASRHLLQILDSPSLLETIHILDAGCGTGLVGAQLSQLGAKKIDGIDLSPGMLQIAGKTGAYKTLKEADMSQTLPFADGTYDAVICVGTLTKTHVGPSAIVELVRVTKVGGVVVATVLDTIYESLGYSAQAHELVSQGKVELLGDDAQNSIIGAGILARVVKLRVVQ